jgi:triacylglycerol esterase/lipase EstA (alpha/beta hydrolase family)
MHELEPFRRWEHLYKSKDDRKSPLYEVESNYERYENDVYGYYIHPAWDYIGSETLYIKILFVDYKNKFAIIELIGEWNDTLHNDIMHLKRNIIDEMKKYKIKHYILIGENVFNFHGSDDCYYEEWYEDVEDGWIAFINFREFIHCEFRKYGVDAYVNYGGNLEIEEWRTLTPLMLFKRVNDAITYRLG